MAARAELETGAQHCKGKLSANLTAHALWGTIRRHSVKVPTVPFPNVRLWKALEGSGRLWKALEAEPALTSEGLSIRYVTCSGEGGLQSHHLRVPICPGWQVPAPGQVPLRLQTPLPPLLCCSNIHLRSRKIKWNTSEINSSYLLHCTCSE